MVLERFYHFLEFEKRYSPHTLIGYKADLSQFGLHLSQNYDGITPDQANHLHIRGWLSELLLTSHTSKTVNRKISTLRSFFRFLERNQLLSCNPMDKVSAPKLERRLPVFVSENEINNLLDHILFEQDFKGTRDRLILEMFYCTGIRLAELIELRHADIDMQVNQIRVKGKGNKQRIIPMIDSLLISYKNYLVQKELLFACNQQDAVFVADSGNKVYRKFVYRVVNTYLSSTTTVSKKSPHVMRHSFATHMLNHGADLNAIKELLGHSSLSATQVYTHNTVEKLKKVYKQAHPKA
jgi:integrase/recombinase XerC